MNMKNLIAEEEAKKLMQAIVKAPDADEPRLDYAEWLKKNGQPARARLIEAQCQIESLKNEVDWILGNNAEEWGKPLRYLGVQHVEFCRGFPEKIQIGATDFMRCHERINELTPVSHLDLGHVMDHGLEELTKLPCMNQIRSLKLGYPSKSPSEYDTGPNGIRALANSQHLQQLTGLTIHSHKIGHTGALVVAQSPTFKNLTQLTLDDPYFRRNRTDDRDIVISSDSLKNLDTLQLGQQIYRRWELLQRRKHIENTLANDCEC
jgi:uncharacterized protein (TIGR02996 family)